MNDIKKTYYLTTDYAQFKRLKGNRDVLDARRSKLIKSNVDVETRAIKRGTFSLTEAEYNAALPAFKFVDRNLLTISRLQGGSLPVAYTSLAWIYRNVDCDIDRLEQTFYNNVARFKPLVSSGHAYFMEDLGRYYNYNLSAKNEISFDGLFKIRKTKEM